MAIPYRYIDFPPVITRDVLAGITVDVQFESLQDTVVRANDGILRHGVRVVNIETVLWPAPLRWDDDATGENGFRCGDLWLVQVVRVWYTKDD